MQEESYTNSDFCKILWTEAEFEAITSEKNQSFAKAKKLTRRARIIIMLSAWICMLMALLSFFLFQDFLTAVLNLALVIGCYLALKTTLIEY